MVHAPDGICLTRRQVKCPLPDPPPAPFAELFQDVIMEIVYNAIDLKSCAESGISWQIYSFGVV